ncbi:BMP and activin membrane-bound inhibitor homolog isoform X2 [Artemia franciscana]|uniref:BMP and activin membrane-bound inhibitor homolog isoform X2 n=1 Tax=Artemia franciscana TaxID=6661 RepID=UPI0032DADEAE
MIHPRISEVHFTSYKLNKKLWKEILLAMKYPVFWCFFCLSVLEEANGTEDFLTCVCTTSACEATGNDICVTAGLCYAQWQDSKDGKDPITRGCIIRRTPLLCQNRKPKLKIGANWPSLYCCSTDLCNKEAVPPPPLKTINGSLTTLSPEDMMEYDINKQTGRCEGSHPK